MADKTEKTNRKSILITLLSVIIVVYVAYFVLRHCVEIPAEILSPSMHEFWICTFLPQVGNAGLLFTLLWWFGWPMLEEMLASRKSRLEHDIEESRKIKEAALDASAKADVLLSELDAEKSRMRVSYEQATAEECARIKAEGQETAERMARDAESAFKLQANLTRKSFEQEVMRQSMTQAREAVISRLSQDPSLRDKLIEQSIANFEI